MPYYRRDPQFQWAGNVNWTSGAHDVRFGGEYAIQHMNQTQPEFPGANFPASGGFRFQGGVTALRDGPSPNEFNSAAAFLLGEARQLGRILQVPEEYNTRQNFYSLYVRDRWQATPQLTFSFGTRWEYFPMPTRADRGMERYDFVNDKMMVCGVGAVPRDCGVDLSRTMFAPGVGLAYRVSDKLVVRAGYAITNDPFSLARPHRTNHPMLLALNVSGETAFTPAGNFTTGIPEIVAPDLGDGIIDVPPQVAVNSVGDTLPRGYIQSWNLTVQRELGAGFVGELGYVATRSVRMLGYMDRNAGQVIGAGNAGRPFFEPVTEPRFGNVAYNSLLGPKQFNMDFGVFRNFQITEETQLQFRAEAFNFTNTPHFNNPNSNASSGNFGQVTSIRNTGREGIDQRTFRFGLRLSF